MKEEKETLLVSCGGTGGHFNPGLSVAREYAAQGGRAVLVLGGIHAEKQQKTAESFSLEARPISSAPLSKNPLKLIRFFWKTFRGVLECRKIFAETHPAALLVMGSFASLPPVLAAYLSGVPVFLHDGNARIGRANRFLSRFAKAAGLSFPAVNASALKCPSVMTGMPLRQEIVKGIRPKAEAVQEINRRWNCGFSADRPVVLIFGGSLGAAAINTRLQADPAMPGLEKLQMIRLSGPGKLEELQACSKDSPARQLLLESCADMDLLYSAADLIICRSGGSTVSELAVYGKYAVLIPYPYAAEGHQLDNAKYLLSGGGAELLNDEDCSPERFMEILKKLLSEPEVLAEKGKASIRLAHPDASDQVIRMIFNIVSADRMKQRKQS